MQIIRLNTIDAYCSIFGFSAPVNPLVAVVDCDEPEKLKPYLINWGFYALFLKDMASCTITYGKTSYDHGDKSIIAFAPGQVCAFEAIPGKDPRFKGVLFHPDFIHGTELGRKIDRYSFFAYSSNEALHLAPAEYGIISNLIEIIRVEADNGATDSLTTDILSGNIGLLLDYCVRFYNRQFSERQELNRDVLRRFENLLSDYLANGTAEKEGLPTVNYFADKICLSPNYFGDLIKRETGVSAKEYMQRKILDRAKDLLLHPEMTITQVAHSLGYDYPQHFVRFFKKMTGQTPTEYRNDYK